MNERNAQIYDAWLSGQHLKAVAKTFGLSVARVHQICLVERARVQRERQPTSPIYDANYAWQLGQVRIKIFERYRDNGFNEEAMAIRLALGDGWEQLGKTMPIRTEGARVQEITTK